MTDQISYRVGRSWGVTVVRQQPGRPDQLVGTMQTPEDAQLTCEALNGRVQYRDRIQAVLDYVAKLGCTNCEHVHDEGDCGATIPDGRACRCGWGPPQVAVDIRDLLKEQP